jgi:uncharacterized protein YeaO (DUF488 family)
MQLTVISAYQTTAENFFQSIISAHADLVIDVRLNNTSQLAGFTKQDALSYLVPIVTKAKYVHDTRFSPEAGLLKTYLAGQIDYQEYFKRYTQGLKEKDAYMLFMDSYSQCSSIVLIGAATKKRHSHPEALKIYLEELNHERK